MTSPIKIRPLSDDGLVELPINSYLCNLHDRILIYIVHIGINVWIVNKTIKLQYFINVDTKLSLKCNEPRPIRDKTGFNPFLKSNFIQIKITKKIYLQRFCPNFWDRSNLRLDWVRDKRRWRKTIFSKTFDDFSLRTFRWRQIRDLSCHPLKKSELSESDFVVFSNPWWINCLFTRWLVFWNDKLPFQMRNCLLKRTTSLSDVTFYLKPELKTKFLERTTSKNVATTSTCTVINHIWLQNLLEGKIFCQKLKSKSSNAKQ